MYWIHEKRFFKKAIGWKALFRDGKKNKLINDTRYYSRVLRPYVEDTRALFVHVPKAAGTSFVEALYGRKDWCHLTASDYEDIHGRNDYEKLIKIAFIRDPFTRFISAYQYLKTSAIPIDQLWRKHFIDNKSLDEFISMLVDCDDVNQLTIEHFRHQSYFVNREIDYIGKKEEYAKSLSEVSDIIGTRIENIKRNTSSSGSILLNRKQKRVIESIYSKDFELYESI